MTAFVLELERNGYGILRGLARKRVPVVGFYTRPDSFGRFSRHCDAHQVAMSEEHMQNALVDRAQGMKTRPVLFPTNDNHVQFLIDNKETLVDSFLYHWVPRKRLGKIVDKAWMSEACKRAGVLSPQTHITRPGEDVAAEARGFALPCIVKPGRSADVTFPTDVKNYVARTIDDLHGFYERYPRALGSTIWQEIIEGGDDQIFQCTVLVRGSGELGAHFCTRKLRQYLPGYGVMCFGRSEENTVVVAEALKLLRHLDYRGLASMEFKRRPSDGRYYFIEMNPRLPWYNSLFAEAGVNLAWLTYLDLTGGEFPTTHGQRDGVHWLAFREDLGWWIRTRGTRSIGLGGWLRSMARTRSWSWWEGSDPMPCLRASLDLGSTMLHRLRGMGASIAGAP